MDIYNLSDFESHKYRSTRSDISVGIKKGSDESFFIKPMFPNQLINLIIANPLFRKCLGEDLIPEVGVAISYNSTPSQYYSILKEINLHSVYDLPHIGNGMRCAGGGWGLECRYMESNIGDINLNAINAERGGLATILFQDSDHHIDNEAYVKKENKYYYIRLDVDHANMVYAPLIVKVMDLNHTLDYYKFSCNALKILAEFIAEREIFKQSILQSLKDISQIFPDERIHDVYQGLEGFKARYDTSDYYLPIELGGNEDFGALVLSNFDLIFDIVQNKLTEINANHSFMLGGVICNPQEEL